MPSVFRLPVIFLDRNGLTENHQGGKTGGPPVEMQTKFCTLSGGSSKSFGGVAQLVERLVVRSARAARTVALDWTAPTFRFQLDGISHIALPKPKGMRG